MAAKLSLVLFAALVIYQGLIWQSDATIVRRDAPQKNASQAIDEAIDSFKSGLDNLVKQVQENEIFQNVSSALKQFGENVQKQGQSLVEKIQSDSSKPKN